jgi:hypothetical protein
MIAGIFGDITNPTKYGTSGDGGNGFFLFLTNIFKFVGVLAGIFFIVQVIMAGFGYLSANGDPKKTEVAFAKIWQSIIGIAIVASAFIIAAFIGRLTGLDFLNFTIYGPQ